ncbi:MAG TPA: hypothetical protein VHD76_05630 [Bryobacteraceae bacterium]|jgi:hypothetical protein|nr:hypothetical protein [Bryobacteraceae bacterium]
MPRTDVYIKVELDHDRDEKVDTLAAELCRHLRKLYNVRTAEVQSIHSRSEE